MPAPTALLWRPNELAEAEADSLPSPSDSQQYSRDLHLWLPNKFATEENGDEILVDATSTEPSAQQDTVAEKVDSVMQVDEEGHPKFPPAKGVERTLKVEARKILIPFHRLSSLKSSWPKIYPPLVEHLKLQVRMNTSARAVEMRTSQHTIDSGALQRGEDFVRAFCLGFDLEDAIAMLRLDDLYIETYCHP